MFWPALRHALLRQYDAPALSSTALELGPETIPHHQGGPHRPSMKSFVAFALSGAVLVNTVAASADATVDGEYSKPSPNCFASVSAPDGLACEAPLEEGVSIKKRNDSTYYLSAKTRGANGHFCEYQGIARWKDDKLVSLANNCLITVAFKDGIAALSSEGEGCQSFCGARAVLFADDLKKKMEPTRRSKRTLRDDPAKRR